MLFGSCLAVAHPVASASLQPAFGLELERKSGGRERQNVAVGQNPVPLVNIKKKWQMDVHPPQNGIAIGYAPWPCESQLPTSPSQACHEHCITQKSKPGCVETFLCRQRFLHIGHTLCFFRACTLEKVICWASSQGATQATACNWHAPLARAGLSSPNPRYGCAWRGFKATSLTYIPCIIYVQLRLLSRHLGMRLLLPSAALC